MSGITPAVAEALQFLLNDGDGDGDKVGLPARLCQACADSLPVTGAAITLMPDSTTQELLCASDDTAAEVKELQFTTGTGPCIDAHEKGGPVLVPDLRDDDAVARWPMFTPAADALGVRAIFAFPMQVGAIRVGVLDLYRDRPGPLDAEAVTAALIAADIVCVALLGLLSSDEHGIQATNWIEQSPYNHSEVHQATGMLMARFEVTAPEAFSRLRALAFLEGQLITEIAGRVVARTVRLDE